MNKKILVVTEAMIPFTKYWGGCQRVYSYSKFLLDKGYIVHIICRNQTENKCSTINYQGIIVTCLGKSTTSVGTEATSNKQNSHNRTIKSILKNNIFFKTVLLKLFIFFFSEPNPFDGLSSLKWAQNALSNIKNYIHENDINVVIVSGPPFGIFHIVKEIKQSKKDIKVILDYRDPWTLWYEKCTMASYAEKRAINYSDYVIASTTSLADALLKKYSKQKIRAILNGYISSSWSNIHNRSQNDKFIISYVGLISINSKNSFRDPTIFLQAANIFTELHTDSVVNFWGVNNANDITLNGTNKRINFFGRIPVEESLFKIQHSNVLIVFHTSSTPSGKYIVCGKIYDYLRSGNLILSIGDYAFANKELIEKNNAGIHCNNNLNEILEALEQLYTRWKDKNDKNECSNISFYSREHQNEQLLDIVKSF